MSFRDRLRPASFIPPSGDTIEFLTNTLVRSGGKKSSTQEIVDSNESTSQDQGNKTYSFPFSTYFTGEDYDLDVDAFIEALEQQYTLDTPGVLLHPRWGDINVFPTEWEQKEELIDGNTIGRVEVTFVEVFPKAFPLSEENNLDSAYGNINDLETLSKETAETMDLEKASSQSNVAGKVDISVGTVSNALKSFVEGIEDLQDQFDAIQSEIDGIVDIADSIVLAISGVQTLIRAPGRILQNTLDRLNTYSAMIQSLTSSIFDENETLNVDKKNNSIMIELYAGFAVASMAESASFTEFTLRSQAVTAIETINDTLEFYNDAFESSRTSGKASEEYSGDHNFYSLLFDTIARINRSILENAFSLKAEKKIILKNNSDVITECYNGYGNVDQNTVSFFVETNKIVENEFIELSAGRELIFYV